MEFRTDNAEPNLARRYDNLVGELLPATTRGTDGALLAEGPAVHEGVLLYPQADGSTRRELVTLDAVNDTVRTIPYAPLTLGHPKEGLVTLDSSERLSVGGVGGEPRTVMEEAVGGFARVMVIIRREDAVNAFNDGTRKLSCGYEVTLDETPGTHPIFGRYDARQTGREVNHLALVDDGRDGRAFLRADSSDAAGTYAPPQRRTDGPTMRPALAALLTTIGVDAAKLDSEDAAVAEAIDILKRDAHEDPEEMTAEDQADASKFGTNLARLAKEKGVTAAQLGKAAGIDPGTVSQIMSGGIKVPPPERIEAFAKVLGVSEGSLRGKLPEGAKEKPMEENEDADPAAEIEALKKELAAMKAAKTAGAAAAEELEQDRADAAERKLLVPLAKRFKVSHENVPLATLRLEVAKVRVDSVDAETPVEQLRGIIMGIPAEKRSDVSRYDQGAGGNGAGNRADGAGGSNRTDASDPDNSHYDPSLARCDAAFAGGDK